MSRLASDIDIPFDDSSDDDNDDDEFERARVMTDSSQLDFSSLSSLMDSVSFSSLSSLPATDLHQVSTQLSLVLTNQLESAVLHTKTLSRKALDWINQREKDRKRQEKLQQQKRKTAPIDHSKAHDSDTLLLTYLSYLTQLIPVSKPDIAIRHEECKEETSVTFNNQPIVLVSDHFGTLNELERSIIHKFKESKEEEVGQKEEEKAQVAEKETTDILVNVNDTQTGIKTPAESLTSDIGPLPPKRATSNPILDTSWPSRSPLHSPLSPSFLPSRIPLGYLSHGSVFIPAADATIVSFNAPAFPTPSKPMQIYRSKVAPKSDLPPLPSLSNTWSGIGATQVTHEKRFVTPTIYFPPSVFSSSSINSTPTDFYTANQQVSSILTSSENITSPPPIHSPVLTNYTPSVPPEKGLRTSPCIVDIPAAPPLTVDIPPSASQIPEAPPFEIPQAPPFEIPQAPPQIPDAPPPFLTDIPAPPPPSLDTISTLKKAPPPLTLNISPNHSSTLVTFKRIHWSKLKYEAVVGSGSMWEDINKGNIAGAPALSPDFVPLDFAEIEDKFKIESQNTKGGRKDIKNLPLSSDKNRSASDLRKDEIRSGESRSNVKAEFTAIDSLRAYNIEIAFAQLKMTVEQIASEVKLESWHLNQADIIAFYQVLSHEIEDLFSSQSSNLSLKKRSVSPFSLPLNLDKLEVLSHIVPTQEEQLRVSKLPPVCTDVSIGNVEKWMRGISGIPRVKQRVELFKFTIISTDELSSIVQTIHTLLSAKHQLMSSVHFRSFLALILTVGNTLNTGTRMGEAYGFRLSWVKEMEGVKRTDGGGSMWDWVVSVNERRKNKRGIEDSEGNSSDGKEDESNHDFLLSLSSIPAAAIIDNTTLTETLTSLRSLSAQLKTELNRTSDPDPYHILLSTFSTHFNPILELVIRNYDNLMEELVNLSIWLGENEGNSKQTGNVFAVVEDMRSMYQKAKERLEQKEKEELEKKQRETRRNKNRPTSMKSQEFLSPLPSNDLTASTSLSSLASIPSSSPISATPSPVSSLSVRGVGMKSNSQGSLPAFLASLSPAASSHAGP